MLYYIPIEPLEERYTEQWYRWFPDAFERNNIEYTVIDGEPLSDVVETGTFLDINSTLHYKAHQLKEISRLFYTNQIQDGDKFFVADIEFWGIESIKYLAVLNNLDVGLYGFCHAGSYTKEDFMGQTSPFAQYVERGWFAAFDKIFVGSKYHKQQMLQLRPLFGDDQEEFEQKIIVSGNPLNTQEILQQADAEDTYPEKKKQIILTNRPDHEKRPQETLQVFEVLKQRYPEWNFIATTGRKQWGTGYIRELGLHMQERGILTIHEGITKSDYYKYLAESSIMVSNSIEENFGYCIVEAMTLRTIPVLRNDFSHPGLVNYNDMFLYDSIDEEIEKIEHFIQNIEEGISPYLSVFKKQLHDKAKIYNRSINIIIHEICRD